MQEINKSRSPRLTLVVDFKFPDTITIAYHSRFIPDSGSRVQFPHSTNICVYEDVCLYWVWAFSMYSMYVFTKKNVHKYVYLSVI
jgi:hypothetical protein